MRRWTVGILVGLSGLIVVAALSGAVYQWVATRRDLAATPPPGELVDIGGHRLHLWCTGKGAPTVILDTGFGVRVLASEHPERVAGLVLVDASHEDDAHEVPPMARFVPVLATTGVFRLLRMSFGQRVESLAPSVRRFALATSFRASGFQTAADELRHLRESASDVRRSRRKLTIPVVVVTGGRGDDERWRRLQRDQASLSDRGCLIVAQRSGHVVALDQPEAVVDAIRSVVETARGRDVLLCATRAPH